MKPRKSINFFASYYDVAKELDNKNRLEWYDTIMRIQFLEEHIDNIDIKSKDLKILFLSVKHSLKSSIEGYCHRMKIDYEALFIHAYGGGQGGGSKGGQGQEEEKEEEEVQVEVQEEYTEWLDLEAWNEWVAFRKEIKKTLTKSTIDKQIKFLEKHIPRHVDIINQSIQNGWSGLFELKEKQRQYETQKYTPVNGMSAAQLRDEMIRREMENDRLKNAINQ